jgi:hypothetical protein
VRAGQLWRDEHSADAERRAKELLDGTYAFRDEELLSLAGPPAPEVAG